jgi:hypothetical protein
MISVLFTAVFSSTEQPIWFSGSHYFGTIAVVGQPYNTYGTPEEIILGNDALLRCTIPSFVADFVTVAAWADSEGAEYFPKSSTGNCCHG